MKKVFSYNMRISLKRIKFKYLRTWFWDQLRQPGWFRRLFIKRNAWGAFSLYSHIKRSNGQPKTTFPLRAQAQKNAEKLSAAFGHPFTVYKCLYCDGWHVSRDASTLKDGKNLSTTDEPEAISFHHAQFNGGLDVKRIFETEIPDLAQVYGGFRGRTLSSSRQMHAWNELIEAGISQVIDLRADYTSDFYRGLCERSGISYFHFPVAYDPDSIDQMVKTLPTFCKLIDNGRFYIACAQGLHRTDIALSLYWVFHGADRDFAPPVLRGYIKQKRMTTNKIMRVLNAVYQRLTELNGEPPMPKGIFQRRKDVINEMSSMA